jgi:hypothetical protein
MTLTLEEALDMIDTIEAKPFKERAKGVSKAANDLAAVLDVKEYRELFQPLIKTLRKLSDINNLPDLADNVVELNQTMSSSAIDIQKKGMNVPDHEGYKIAEAFVLKSTDLLYAITTLTMEGVKLNERIKTEGIMPSPLPTDFNKNSSRPKQALFTENTNKPQSNIKSFENFCKRLAAGAVVLPLVITSVLVAMVGSFSKLFTASIDTILPTNLRSISNLTIGLGTLGAVTGIDLAAYAATGKFATDQIPSAKMQKTK